jgi:DNA-binding response OmpR family regulator
MMQINPKKILIIEDDFDLAAVLRDALTDAGFIVVIARDGEEGLRVALDQQPDMILLDVLLPKKEGLALLKELRDDARGKSIPVTVLTNYSGTEHVNRALAYGARNFLVKASWDIDSLVEEVKTALKLN